MSAPSNLSSDLKTTSTGRTRDGLTVDTPFLSTSQRTMPSNLSYVVFESTTNEWQEVNLRDARNFDALGMVVYNTESSQRITSNDFVDPTATPDTIDPFHRQFEELNKAIAAIKAAEKNYIKHGKNADRDSNDEPGARGDSDTAGGVAN